ncbi:MAG: hypothetical protein HY910_12500 [Desulfarculus sp.]|nr:hypothetical protein [Desulfarculus sp.]
MALLRQLGRWFFDHFGPLDDPSQDGEALEGSPLDLARALELAVDHCCLTPSVTAPPSDSRTDGDPS